MHMQAIQTINLLLTITDDTWTVNKANPALFGNTGDARLAGVGDQTISKHFKLQCGNQRRVHSILEHANDKQHNRWHNKKQIFSTIHQGSIRWHDKQACVQCSLVLLLLTMKTVNEPCMHLAARSTDTVLELSKSGTTTKNNVMGKYTWSGLMVLTRQLKWLVVCDPLKFTKETSPIGLNMGDKDSESFPLPEWENMISSMKEVEWQAMLSKNDKAKAKEQAGPTIKGKCHGWNNHQGHLRPKQ